MSLTPGLRSIVYASEATSIMTSSDLEALLTSARDLNRKNGISGVLLYSGKQFLQCFEGPADAVQETYGRIKRSHQHKDVVVHMDSPVLTRTFDDWAMGCATPTTSELLKLSTAEWDASNAAKPFSPGSPPGLGMLKFFWDMRSSEL